MNIDQFKSLFGRIILRQDIHEAYEKEFVKYIPADATVYDIGCGKKPFEKFLKGKVKLHIGVDLADGFYQPDKVDIIGTAYSVPADDAVADVVISSQVIEHLERPLEAIQEAHRLLKSGGILFLSFPFLYPIHAEPRDFLRYTHFYVEKEIAEGKFQILECQKFGGFWYFFGMSLDIYLQNFDRGILRKLYIVRGLQFVSGTLFKWLHALEGFLSKVAKKDVDLYRTKWTSNYLMVLKKL